MDYFTPTQRVGNIQSARNDGNLPGKDPFYWWIARWMSLSEFSQLLPIFFILFINRFCIAINAIFRFFLPALLNWVDLVFYTSSCFKLKRDFSTGQLKEIARVNDPLPVRNMPISSIRMTNEMTPVVVKCFPWVKKTQCMGLGFNHLVILYTFKVWGEKEKKEPSIFESKHVE